ncbi:MAG: SEC-C metal-binding domain-containing protein [bacterium]
MTKPGKNDACPCGSGKKYKDCCMEKEGEPEDKPAVVIPLHTSEESAASGMTKPAPSGSELDGNEEGTPFDRSLKSFKFAPHERKVSVALDCIEKETEFDEEMASQILAALCMEMEQEALFFELDKVIRKIKDCHPDLYKKEAGWFNLYLVDAAVAHPKVDLFPYLSAILSDLGEVYDPFLYIENKVLFYGRDADICEAVQKCWPEIESSEKLSSSDKEEVKVMQLSLLLNHELETNPGFDPKDPGFVSRAEPFMVVDLQWLEQVVVHLSGRSFHKWKPEDFQTRDWEILFRNIFLFTMEFSGTLCNKHGWNRGRAMLAQHEICEYTADRLLRGHHKRKKAFSEIEVKNLILPERESIEDHLETFLSLYEHDIYPAAAFCAALPPLVDFLAAAGFCDAKEAELLQNEVKTAVMPALSILVQENDPVLIGALQSAYTVSEEEIEAFLDELAEEDFDDTWDELLKEAGFPASALDDMSSLLESFTSGQRENIEDKSLKADTTLSAALKKQPAHWVEAFCRQADIFGLEKKNERIEALLTVLPKEESLTRLWSGLPFESRLMLKRILDAGGHMTLEELEKEFGPDEDETWFWDLGEFPATPLGLLRLNSLVFVGKTKRKKERVKIASVPVELREGLGKIASSPGAFENAHPLPDPYKDGSGLSRLLGEEDDVYDDGPLHELAGLSDEEEMDFIREFVDKYPYSKMEIDQYEAYLEKLRENDDEESRELIRKILLRKTQAKKKEDRLSAYQELYNRFGEEYIKPALEDRAQAVRDWAHHILDPGRGKLF